MENFPITPEVLKYIKEIASNLPKVQNGEQTKEVIIKGRDLIRQLLKEKPDSKPPYKFKNGKVIKPGRKYVYNEPIMINHVNMIKAAWRHKGKPGVDEYIFWIKNNYNKQVTDKAKGN